MIQFITEPIFRTIIAIGYNISMDKPPARIRAVRLPNDPFLQTNGYKPAPLDLSAIELSQKMEELVDLLSENTHNLWAKERIGQGWTYGLNEDPDCRRSPHLLPYQYVDISILRNILYSHSVNINQDNSDFHILQNICTYFLSLVSCWRCRQRDALDPIWSSSS